MPSASKTLVIMRHAKAEDADAAPTDHERPLKMRGVVAAMRMGKLFQEEKKWMPQHLDASTARRVQTTVELFVKHSAFNGPPVAFHDELYLARPETYVSILSRNAHDDQTRMVVGHNPGLEQLIYALTGKYEAMATASIAILRLNVASWGELKLEKCGDILKVWHARQLLSEDEF